MSGAIPPLPQYDFTTWCLVKAQGQLYLLLLLVHSHHPILGKDLKMRHVCQHIIPRMLMQK